MTLSVETEAALALVAAGVPVTAVERTVRMLELDDFDDQTSVRDKVEQLQADTPGLFTATGPAPAPYGRQRPAPRPGPAKVGQIGDARAAARRRLGLVPSGDDAA